MNRFFLNAMLVADLGTGTFQRMPLPEKALASGDLSVLAELFPKDVVTAAGRLSGSYAPSSCVLAVYADGKTWTARSVDDTVIPAGSRVVIESMQGVKLYVKPVEMKMEV